MQKSSVASGRKAAVSVFHDQHGCLRMLMICMLPTVAVCSIDLHCNVDISRHMPSVNAPSHCASFRRQLPHFRQWQDCDQHMQSR